MINAKSQFPAFVGCCPISLSQADRTTDERVRKQTDEERQLYELLSKVTGSPGSLLSSRWREPSLTVHKLVVSGPGSKFGAVLALHGETINARRLHGYSRHRYRTSFTTNST